MNIMNPTTATLLPPIRISTSDHARLRALLNAVTRAQPRLRETLQPLSTELDRAEVLPPGATPRNVVAMGSTVQLEDCGSGEIETYTLVFPEQADAAAGRLSILAPIGMAIIGFTEGDTFSWRTPGGTRQLLLRKVEPPAAA